MAEPPCERGDCTCLFFFADHFFLRGAFAGALEIASSPSSESVSGMSSSSSGSLSVASPAGTFPECCAFLFCRFGSAGSLARFAGTARSFTASAAVAAMVALAGAGAGAGAETGLGVGAGVLALAVGAVASAWGLWREAAGEADRFALLRLG